MRAVGQQQGQGQWASSRDEEGDMDVGAAQMRGMTEGNDRGERQRVAE